MLANILHEHGDNPPVELLRELLGLAVDGKENEALREALAGIGQRQGGQYETWQLAAVSGFLDGVERQAGSLPAFQKHAPAELKGVIGPLADLFVRARELALNPSEPEANRVLAVRLLGRGGSQPCCR